MAGPTEVRTAADIANLPMRRVTDRLLVERRATAWKRISWGSVWAGNAIAWVGLILLNMLGMVFAIRSPWLSTVWFYFSAIAAFYVGALVAGRLSNIIQPDYAALHGIMAWALTIIEAFFLGSSVFSAMASTIAAPSISASTVRGLAPLVGEQILNALTLGSSATLTASVSVLSWIIFGLMLVSFLAALMGGYDATPDRALSR